MVSTRFILVLWRFHVLGNAACNGQQFCRFQGLVRFSFFSWKCDRLNWQKYLKNIDYLLPEHGVASVAASWGATSSKSLLVEASGDNNTSILSHRDPGEDIDTDDSADIADCGLTVGVIVWVLLNDTTVIHRIMEHYPNSVLYSRSMVLLKKKHFFVKGPPHFCRRSRFWAFSFFSGKLVS